MPCCCSRLEEKEKILKFPFFLAFYLIIYVQGASKERERLKMEFGLDFDQQWSKDKHALGYRVGFLILFLTRVLFLVLLSL